MVELFWGQSVTGGLYLGMMMLMSLLRIQGIIIDCVSALLYILLKGEKGHAYNVADKNSCVTIRELADMIAKIGGRRVNMVVPDDSESKGYNVVTNSVFSTAKLESLGWTVSGNMEQKLRKTILSERERWKI